MSVYKYTCFDSRALNESRLIFAFSGIPFEEDIFVRNTWAEEKSNYTWGQLPVLEVDGKMLSQSRTVVRYLGNKFNLAGDNDFEAAKCDEMIEAMADLQKLVFPVIREEDESKKNELLATLRTETFPKYFIKWDTLVKENAGFLVGRRISYADIFIASYLQVFNDLLGGDILDNFSALKTHNASIFNAPGIKEWVASRPKTQF